MLNCLQSFAEDDRNIESEGPAPSSDTLPRCQRSCESAARLGVREKRCLLIEVKRLPMLRCGNLRF